MAPTQVQAISAESLRQNPKESMRILLTRERVNELGKMMETESSRSAIVDALGSAGMKDLFLSTLKDEKVANKVAELMRSPNGMEVMGKLARTLEGGDLIGALFNSKEGQQLFVKIMTGSGLPFIDLTLRGPKLDATGFEVARRILVSQTFSDVREQQLPPVKRTAFGRSFEAFLAGKTDDTLANPGFSAMVAGFLSSKDTCDEAKSIFKNFIKTKENRSQLVKLMASPEGIKTLQGATKTKEGIDVVGYLWNTKDGRLLFRELIVSPDGAVTAFHVMQNQLRGSKNLQDNLIGRILNTDTVRSIVEKEISRLRSMIFKIEHEKGK